MWNRGVGLEGASGYCSMATPKLPAEVCICSLQACVHLISSVGIGVHLAHTVHRAGTACCTNPQLTELHPQLLLAPQLFVIPSLSQQILNI